MKGNYCGREFNRILQFTAATWRNKHFIKHYMDAPCTLSRMACQRNATYVMTSKSGWKPACCGAKYLSVHRQTCGFSKYRLGRIPQHDAVEAEYFQNASTYAGPEMISSNQLLWHTHFIVKHYNTSRQQIRVVSNQQSKLFNNWHVTVLRPSVEETTSGGFAFNVFRWCSTAKTLTICKSPC